MNSPLKSSTSFELSLNAIKPKYSSIKRNVNQQDSNKLLQSTQFKPIIEILPFRDDPPKHDKIEAIIKNNSKLLNENAELSELLNEKVAIIEHLRQLLETNADMQMATIQDLKKEKEGLVQAAEQKYYDQQMQNDRLQLQIDSMRKQFHDLDKQKNKQVQETRQKLINQYQSEIQGLKMQLLDNTEMLEGQNHKIKQHLESISYQYETEKHELKISNTRLTQQISQLSWQLKHDRQQHQLLLQQAKMQYQAKAQQITRNWQTLLQKLSMQHQASIKRLKKQLSERLVEVQRLTEQMANHIKQHELDRQQLVDYNDKLRLQMLASHIQAKQIIHEQKQKVLALSMGEKAQLEATHNSSVQILQSQIRQYKQLLALKQEQIGVLHKQICSFEQFNQDQLQHYINLAQQLRTKLDQQATHHARETQLLNIKLAQLYQADISSLKTMYENNIAALTQEAQLYQEMCDKWINKYHEEVDNNTNRRKQLELDQDQQKDHYYRLHLKYLHLEAQLGCKIQEIKNIQTENDRQLKEHTKADERQKEIHDKEIMQLKELIFSKDRELLYVNDKILKMIQYNENADVNMQTMVEQFAKYQREVEARFEIRFNLANEQFQRRLAKAEGQKQMLEAEIENIHNRTCKDLTAMITDLQNREIVLTKSNQTKQSEAKALQCQLDKCKADSEDAKAHLQVILEQQRLRRIDELKFKSQELQHYYQDLLNGKDAVIKQLQHNLSDKQQHIRDLTIQNSQTEQKIAESVAAMGKLTDFERKVQQVGTDNNLLKNLAELTKYR